MSARTALVVGGTSGIGAATALRFGADGATVIAAGLGGSEAPPELRRVADVRELDLREPHALEDLIAVARRSRRPGERGRHHPAR